MAIMNKIRGSKYKSMGAEERKHKLKQSIREFKKMGKDYHIIIKTYQKQLEDLENEKDNTSIKS